MTCFVGSSFWIHVFVHSVLQLDWLRVLKRTNQNGSFTGSLSLIRKYHWPELNGMWSLHGPWRCFNYPPTPTTVRRFNVLYARRLAFCGLVFPRRQSIIPNTLLRYYPAMLRTSLQDLRKGAPEAASCWSLPSSPPLRISPRPLRLSSRYRRSKRSERWYACSSCRSTLFRWVPTASRFASPANVGSRALRILASLKSSKFKEKHKVLRSDQLRLCWASIVWSLAQKGAVEGALSKSHDAPLWLCISVVTAKSASTHHLTTWLLSASGVRERLRVPRKYRIPRPVFFRPCILLSLTCVPRNATTT